MENKIIYVLFHHNNVPVYLKIRNIKKICFVLILNLIRENGKKNNIRNTHTVYLEFVCTIIC